MAVAASLIFLPQQSVPRSQSRLAQAARLAQTHADLLGSPRYARAATFFLSDLYGEKDFSERDAEVERILPLMTSMLPVSGLRTLLLAVEVDALSERFDAAMVQVLGDRLDPPTLSEAAYAEAYRAVGDRAGRETQIRLIGETGEALEALARKAADAFRVNLRAWSGRSGVVPRKAPTQAPVQAPSDGIDGPPPF